MQCPALRNPNITPQFARGPFTSSQAPVSDPARVWPLLTEFCDPHRSLDGANPDLIIQIPGRSVCVVDSVEI